MKPILSDSFPVVGNGLGGLSDAIECVVAHEINGIYELSMRYPVTGQHFDELVNGRIIMAAPDDLTTEQPFRIYRITKPLNGVVTVYARHICYDMAGIVVEPFTAGSLTEAMQTLPSVLSPSSSFNIGTTRTVASGMKITEPRPLWKLLGGQAGSFLDVYGGEWDFDGYDATLVTKLGTDRGVSIRYGKNLTELEQDGSIEGTYSGVYPYWLDEETNTLVTLTEKYVAVPGSIVRDRVFVLDCTGDFENQPTEQELRDRANAYITANSIGAADISWKVSFADDPELRLDRVMLGDTLHVYYERLDVNATARAVKTEWDVLADRYKTITVGKVKQNLAAIIVNNQKETAAQFEGMRSDMETAVDKATDFIRNGEGYMRFIYNSNNELREIVSLDDSDILQAASVWRWNNGGFGHSSTGYNGAYTVAITQDGSIVADFITTGTLTANVIRAGILQDVLGKNSWNLDTGVLTLTDGLIQDGTGNNSWNLSTGVLTLSGYITAGDLSTSGQSIINGANITTGIIKDASNKNSWNLNTGALTITNGSLNIATATDTTDQIILNHGAYSSMQSPRWHMVKRTTTAAPGGYYFAQLDAIAGAFTSGNGNGSTVFTNATAGSITAGGSGTNGSLTIRNSSDTAVLTLNTSSDIVVEKGASGIWRYRKWASGWLECWGTIAAAEHTFQAWGTGYYSTEVGAVNYPLAFSGAPYELAKPLSGDAWVSLMSSSTRQTATKCGGYRAFRPVSGNATFGVEIYAFGTSA